MNEIILLMKKVMTIKHIIYYIILDTKYSQKTHIFFFVNDHITNLYCSNIYFVVLVILLNSVA